MARSARFHSLHFFDRAFIGYPGIMINADNKIRLPAQKRMKPDQLVFEPAAPVLYLRNYLNNSVNSNKKLTGGKIQVLQKLRYF